jgi:ribosomal-protein-alanine N-acetyltransferase
VPLTGASARQRHDIFGKTNALIVGVSGLFGQGAVFNVSGVEPAIICAPVLVRLSHWSRVLATATGSNPSVKTRHTGKIICAFGAGMSTTPASERLALYEVGGDLQQGDSVDLLDPEGKLAALFHGAEPEPVPVNGHSVRVAATIDAADMDEVERLAFPTLLPPTRFRREIERSSTLYLLAVREWTEEEIALGPEALSRNDGSSGLFARIFALPLLLVKLLVHTIGGRRVIMPAQSVAGFVGLWFVMDEAHVVTIGNRPGDRRKGIGELLLITALEAATKQGSRVATLEVRASNEAAKALYHKYGFRDVGVRKRYYADNNEDAVIMMTPPIRSDEYREHFLELVRDHAQRWGETERRVG